MLEYCVSIATNIRQNFDPSSLICLHLSFSVYLLRFFFNNYKIKLDLCSSCFRKSTKGCSKFKVRKRDKFRRDLLVSILEHMQIPNGTGPGVWGSKCPLFGMPHQLQIFYGDLSLFGKKFRVGNKVQFGNKVSS